MWQVAPGTVAETNLLVTARDGGVQVRSLLESVVCQQRWC